MTVKDVWKPVGTCANCHETEYGRFTEDSEWGTSKRAAGRRCKGGCTAEEVAEAEEREAHDD
ncbi:hypothetical protein L1085_016330 [Streptomyces sp. MSC1_001]|jgi:hypothetical protein|uniref:hypothetical protein n=1 Tax=Streptomyces sp. MSC1_001 TaxID=2909263 RepID=UPI002030E21F|nr:hypothetical protein [Streptomyces sp. MSC1_001]